MTLFEDFLSQGAIFKQLRDEGLIRKAFDQDFISECSNTGLYDELYSEDHQDFDQLDAPLVYVVYLDEYKSELLQSLIDAYVPLSSIKQAGHFFDFLLVNTELKLVYGMGLGQKTFFLLHKC